MKLSDLVNFDHIQKMVDSNFKATGMPTGIIDVVDGEIFAGVGWQDICVNFHRKNPISLQRCIESDTQIKEHIKSGTPHGYTCKNGMRDIGIPIIVDKIHVATLFLGQFFYEDEIPERDFFISQAKDLGYDLKEYLNALDRVPRFHKEKVKNILAYNSGLARFIGDLATNNKKLKDEIETRNRAERELSRTKKLLSNIIDSMPSVLIGVDSNGKVTQWNMTAKNITGIGAADARGKDLSTVFPRMAQDMKRIKESIRTREIQKDKKKARTSKQGLRYDDVTIYPLIANGVEGAVLRIDDITDQVRMEEMMIQSEKMLSVGGLAAGMAHEINNPLAGMIQTASVMGNRLTSETMPANLAAAAKAGTTMATIRAFMEEREIPPMVTAIKESGSRVAQIVNNMLSFARNGDAQCSSVDMADLIDKTLALASTDYNLKKKYDFRQIEIVKEYQENLPTIACERSKLQQVLLNILTNGAQAMQEEKKRENSGKNRFVLKLSFEKQNNMVRIEIEDNGPGMVDAIRKRVFEPFFTTKPEGLGTGLGLSVSYFIITENHGGTMAVESAPGKGTKFIICLPRGQA
ncbi:MAG: PocR ligand-binding domain-containing protein [Desulfobacterium sp.]|nr:PocR ligand-binding domain-containing protein [Desulfobacterium sp.]